jgi:hypothetical protein
VPTKPADLSALALREDALVYQGQARPLSSIAHLRFARMEVTTYMVPVKLGTEGSVGLVIEFTNGDQLYFREKPGWVLTSSQHKIDGIIELYDHLARSTYEQRLNAYLQELEQRGYFDYSGHQFHAATRSIRVGDRHLTSENTEFLRHYNYIELKPKQEGFLRKAQMKVWGGKVQSVDVLTDTDVFFALLAHFYGLRWN